MVKCLIAVVVAMGNLRGLRLPELEARSKAVFTDCKIYRI
jgi:hypothetical protein